MTTREIKLFNPDEYYTVEEAAKYLGIKESAIRNYLSLGRLITYKIKTLTLLKVEEVKRWRERQR